VAKSETLVFAAGGAVGLLETVSFKKATESVLYIEVKLQMLERSKFETVGLQC